MHFWAKKNLISIALLPFSYLYRLIVIVHQLLYRLGLKKVHRFSVPVIVVGNITVGGTGKTPFVIYLAEHFKQKGFKPGIVSRGYGGKAKHFPQIVTENSDPALVGDEPVLMAQRTNCPVVVAPDRPKAVQLLLKQFKCDIVISDDGLQHYALGRDIEIVLVDASKGFGNGFSLPAGPLRESVARLNSVDCIVLNQGSCELFDFQSLNGDFLSPIVNMQLKPSHIDSVKPPQILLNPKKIKTPIHGVAGIGNPARFFHTLSQMGFDVMLHPFPDHHIFKKTDIDYPGIVIMTEKDAVKCKAFADERHYALGVDAVLDDEGFLTTCFSCSSPG